MDDGPPGLFLTKFAFKAHVGLIGSLSHLPGSGAAGTGNAHAAQRPSSTSPSNYSSFPQSPPSQAPAESCYYTLFLQQKIKSFSSHLPHARSGSKSLTVFCRIVAGLDTRV